MSKITIYQVMTRLFGNKKNGRVPYGTMEENGVGKFSDFTSLSLKKIRDLGISHIWYTGIIEHATVSDYSQFGIPQDYAEIIKGRAGSPYAIKDYFDVHPDLAENVPQRMKEFLALVKRTHDAGMKIIIDFVPNHLARNYQSDSTPQWFEDFGRNDNTTVVFSTSNDFYYIPGETLELPDQALENGRKMQDKNKYGYYQESPAKVTGNNIITSKPSYSDWYETVKLNYGIDLKNGGQKHLNPIPSVWKKMLQVLNFWARLGIDGFRVDMAEMVPVEFWRWVLHQVKNEFPDVIFIAEIYKPHQYREFIESGFDFLYDKKGFYETLRHILEGNLPAESITRIWQDIDGLDKHMVRFLENHDEERIASDQFSCEPKAAIPGMLLAATMNKGPVMVYSGQEVGEPAKGVSGFSGDDGKTTIFDYWHIPEHQKWMNGGKFDGGGLSEDQKVLRGLYQKILNLSLQHDSFSKGYFYDLMWANQDHDWQYQGKIYSYLRYTENHIVLCVLNFDKSQTKKVFVKIPEHAIYLLQFERSETLKLIEIFPENHEKICSVETLIREGIELEVQSNMGLVIKLEVIS